MTQGARTVKFNDLVNKDLDKDTVIEIKKKMGPFYKEIRKRSKQRQCYWCGKPLDGTCNSHSVPAFCIRSIAQSGKVYGGNHVLKIPTIDEEYGVNNAGTFHIICDECDNLLFREYENPDNYVTEPTQQMLFEIDLKNHLKVLDKKLRERELYSIQKEEFGMSVFNTLMSASTEEDYLDFERELEKLRRRIGKKGDWYYLGYYIRLPYTVPIAFQSWIPLIFDIDGQLVNDVFCHEPEYHLDNLGICVLPFNGESFVFAFVEEKTKRYRKFFKQLNNLGSDKKRLAIINYIIFSYSEECLLSPRIPEDRLAGLEVLIGKSMHVLQPDLKSYRTLDVVKPEFDFHEAYDVPNLLSEEFAITE